MYEVCLFLIKEQVRENGSIVGTHRNGDCLLKNKPIMLLIKNSSILIILVSENFLVELAFKFIVEGFIEFYK